MFFIILKVTSWTVCQLKRWIWFWIKRLANRMVSIWLKTKLLMWSIRSTDVWFVYLRKCVTVGFVVCPPSCVVYYAKPLEINLCVLPVLFVLVTLYILFLGHISWYLMIFKRWITWFIQGICRHSVWSAGKSLPFSSHLNLFCVSFTTVVTLITAIWKRWVNFIFLQLSLPPSQLKLFEVFPNTSLDLISWIPSHTRPCSEVTWTQNRLHCV